MDALIGLPEVARRLGVSPWRVRKFVKAGELVPVNLGGVKRPEYRFEPREVERLIAARRVVVTRAKGRRAAGPQIPTYA